MGSTVYERLADALDRLPNRFPRTESGVEIAILQKIFTLEEAGTASQMGREHEPFDVIATRVGLEPETAKRLLSEMARKGMVRSDVQAGQPQFRLNQWLVGLYEQYGLSHMDHEFFHLAEAYFAEGGLAGIMRPQPAIHRVLPAQQAVKSEWILPYDDVKAILEQHLTFTVRPCTCRVQQDHINKRRCDFPVDICLGFSAHDRSPRPGDISKQDALALLDQAEEIGLVHSVTNVIEGLSYVCNCCSCCCAILRGITDFGIKDSIAYANYYSTIDHDTCIGCGVCVKRCQVQAISLDNNVAEVDRKQCIGCGLCVTKCPTGAAQLQRKPASDIVHPPLNFGLWEQERLQNQHMIE
jgi:formate hydrogenlyase subunit 6/NADH:ubiquinone oxidoreductase subunit I